MQITKTWRLLGTLMIVLLLVVACGGGDDDASDNGGGGSNPNQETTGGGNTGNTTGPTARPTLPDSIEIVTGQVFDEAEATATLRFVHAVAGLDRVDVLLGEQVVFRNVAPLAGTLPINRPPGEYQLTIRPNTATGDGSEEGITLLDVSIELQEDRALILALTRDGDGLYSGQVFEENTAVLTPGDVRVQFINLLTDTTLTFESNGEVLAEDITPATSSDFIVLGEGDYVFDLLEADRFVLSGQEMLEQGTLYSFLALGHADNVRFIALARETPPQGRFRITHAAPDTPPLVLRVAESEIEAVLGFGESTAFEMVLAERFSVDVFRANLDGSIPDDLGEVVASGSFTMPDFGAIELVVMGADTDLRVNSYPIDTDPVVRGNTRVLFINAAYEFDRVSSDIPTLGNVINPMVFASDQLVTITPTQVQLSFITSDDETVEIVEQSPRPIRFENGRAYTYVITGRADEFEDLIFLPIDFVEETTNPDTVNTEINLPQIQIVNNWTQTIQVNFNDERIALGLPPGEISEPSTFRPELTRIQILDVDEVLLYEREFSFAQEEDRDYTLYISSEDAGIVLTVLPASGLPLPAEQVQLRFIHLTPNFEEIVIEASDDDSFSIYYRSGSAPLNLPSGEREIRIYDFASGELLYRETLNFARGNVYDILVEFNEQDQVGLVLVNRTESRDGS